MAANSSTQITSLDFDIIKANFKQFLQSQDILKDYNYEGSGLSVLMDLLAYNTQYNAFYLNMVSNEMFLDTALRRSSVVSQAKLLNYIPKSSVAPSANIKLVVNQVNTPTLTLPKYTNFLSESIDGVNYNFLTVDDATVTVSSNTATFGNVIIKQGTHLSTSYTVDTTTNPSCTFDIPNANVDTSTLIVTVQPSSSNTYTDVYTLASGYTELNGNSMVYFLQEGLTGNYQIYFGDGIIGKQLTNGNYVTINYISTNGTSSAGANNFVLMDTISGNANTIVYPIFAASQGGEKESIDSIRFQAPKAYGTQGRAVSKNDYITLIQQNNLGFAFDAVSVWGGEQNVPPVYGQVFISIKPKGSLTLTDTQKQALMNEVIKPFSVMTVEPTILDPDYTYLQLTCTVYYAPAKTTHSAGELQSVIQTAIQNYVTNNLNTFNSTFSQSDLILAIQNSDPSIITNELVVKIQKKFYPNLSTATTYNLNYGVSLAKGILTAGVTSSPGVKYKDPITPVNTIDGVYLEEIPSATGPITSISIVNPGYNYTAAPTVTISGDGTGATAEAVIVNNAISQINLTASGNNYSTAVVTITPAAGDSTGTGAAAYPVLQSQYGTIRSYYYNAAGVKTILNSNVGTIDYLNGTVTLNSFSPTDVDNPLGQLTITANPASTIINSSFNRIVTVDPYDGTAIIVNLVAKTST